MSGEACEPLGIKHLIRAGVRWQHKDQMICCGQEGIKFVECHHGVFVIEALWKAALRGPSDTCYAQSRQSPHGYPAVVASVRKAHREAKARR